MLEPLESKRTWQVPKQRVLSPRGWFELRGTALFAILVMFQAATADEVVDDFTRLLIEHAKRSEEQVLREGRRLDPVELEIALKAGVQHPQRVRILTLDAVPLPENPIVAEEFERMGVLRLIRQAAAAARGYGIILTPRALNRDDALAHELVHVAQFERFGGIGPMFRAHIPDLRAHGYRRSELEDEAYRRAAEIMSGEN